MTLLWINNRNEWYFCITISFIIIIFMIIYPYIRRFKLKNDLKNGNTDEFKQINITDCRNIWEMVAHFFQLTGQRYPIDSISTGSRSYSFFFNELSLIASSNTLKFISLESAVFFGVAEVVCKVDMTNS